MNTSRWRLTNYLVASLIVCQPPIGAAADTTTAEQEILLAVTVNDKKITDTTLILDSTAHGIIVPSQLLTDARLRLPDVPAIDHNHENYYPLDAVSGLHAEIDTATQTLKIAAAPTAFISSAFNAADHQRLVAQASETGAFLNYDINYAKVQGQSQDNLSGLVELGIFSAGGTYTSRFISTGVNGERTTFRLDSQYSRDFPERQATMVIGDSISGASAFSRQVYFGGVQWKTNFSASPGFESIPLPTFSGTAAAPSTVDIYVDNILKLRQAVDTGPFSINNVPVNAGEGNVRMVVHDVLGRQQVYTQNYLASALLLKEGTQNVSYELGVLRNNFGNQNSRYGQAFSSGTIRYGMRNDLTLETHGELTLDGQSLGVGSAVALGNIGLLSAGLAASNHAGGNGTLQYLQFDHQGKDYALSARAQTAGARFWQLGMGDNIQAPAQQIQAQASVSPNDHYNFSIGYLSQANRGTDNVRAVNAGINFNLHNSGSISVGFLKSLTQDRTLSANVVWVIPLGHQSMLQVALSGQKGSKSLSSEYQQSASSEGGWGFRARKGVYDNSSEDIGTNYITPNGEYMLNANRANGLSNVQLEARGGIAMLDGHVRATRWLDQSFAIVEVPVKQAIDIYANNIKVGQTDQNGVGFISRLIPYEVNDVRLDDAGIPLSMTLDLAHKSIVPGPRSASLLTFSAQHHQSATLTLTDKNGTPLATGTLVHVNENSTAEVALNGQVFIPDIAYPATIVVDSDNYHCRMKIAETQTEAFPVLGPFVCSEESK
ncbi:fimbria/pilus outer membrane usher protein [Glaciimonas sp. GG7]